jgi:nucleotide-binding universal stress UspA family protein
MTEHTLLHPTDLSPRSRLALHQAVAQAETRAARLLILHVVPTLGCEQLTFGEMQTQRQPAAYRQRLWHDFRQRLALPPTSAHVELALGEGKPATAILHMAGAEHCDLIVLAEPGDRRWWHWLLPATVEEVLRGATCPVLIVKAQEAAAARRPPDGSARHSEFLVQQWSSFSPPLGRGGTLHVGHNSPTHRGISAQLRLVPDTEPHGKSLETNRHDSCNREAVTRPRCPG